MTFFMILFICVFNHLSHDFSSNILKHLKINGDIAYKIYTVPYTFPYFNFMLKKWTLFVNNLCIVCLF